MGRLYVPQLRVALVREGRMAVETKQIAAPRDAAAIFRQFLGDLDREAFVIMGLSVKNHVLGVHVVSIGSLDSTIVHPREVFTPALLMKAASIIVAHNHPSGDPTPSAEDRRVTERLIEAGKILGIEVIDHVIVSGDSYRSLRESGLL
jgi:DNA repair protein RadC